MNLREVLHNAREILSAAGIEDAGLEAEVLLRYLMNIDRTFLFTHDDSELSSGDYTAYLKLVERRCAGEPTAYIIGNKEFYGLDFLVTTSVLIPRPETELLVEAAIDQVKKHDYRIVADIGTGSGCIAITLALNLQDISVYAVDISSDALEVVRKNSRKHGVEDRITFLEGDLLEPLPDAVDMIVANLPYVDEPSMEAVNTRGYEPDTALFGGKDGLDLVSTLLRQAVTKCVQGGTILLEIGIGQSEPLERIIKKEFPGSDSTIIKDFAGIDRIISVDLS